jgi:multimeric flavodoxin WrbA
MNVVAVSGSARRAGNTALLLETVLQPLREAGHECELIEIAGKDIRGCTACGRCREHRDGQCHGRSDFINELMPKLFEADAILLGSPTYFADVSTEMKALIDRVGYVARHQPELLARKPGAAVVAVRRGGAIHALDTLNHFFLISEMILVGSSYWNIGIGREKGEVEEDAEGMRTMKRLGENLAWVLDRIEGGK